MAAAAEKVTTTYAGEGKAGAKDGKASEAEFNSPRNLALLADGSLLVADIYNNKIRAVKDGVVSTYAGAAAKGFKDGKSDEAQFAAPAGVCVDSKGNVYVADSENARIRLISNGVVSTFAGSGVKGNMDGAAAKAKFKGPSAVAVDENGVVYVSEDGSNRIRMIKDGVVSTIGGSGFGSGHADGPGKDSKFSMPSGIAVDAKGTTVYVADTGNERLRAIDIKSGDVTTLAGTKEGWADGKAASAKLSSPFAVCVAADGTVYFADGMNKRIRTVKNGEVKTIAGMGGPPATKNGPALASSFNVPKGIAVDAKGNVYISDTNSNVIRLLADGGAAPAADAKDSKSAN